MMVPIHGKTYKRTELDAHFMNDELYMSCLLQATRMTYGKISEIPSMNRSLWEVVRTAVIYKCLKFLGNFYKTDTSTILDNRQY
jgi:hypothetical protein